MEKLTKYESVIIKLIIKAYQREIESEVEEIDQKKNKTFLDRANYPRIKNEMEQIKEILKKL